MEQLSIEEEIFLLHAINKFYRMERLYDGKFNYHDQDRTFTLDYGRYDNAVVFTDFEYDFDEEIVVVRSRELHDFSDEILDDYIENEALPEYEAWIERVRDEQNRCHSVYADYARFDYESFKVMLESQELCNYVGKECSYDAWMKHLYPNPERKYNHFAKELVEYASYTIYYD